ncbi:TRAP transporter small permease [Halomonas marinisediminis]|uniref:TRAP transporter small permease protein n=1 Tax=Halomonas marinisediminis TaxID=2546095 RepID=A0ABY2DAU8_9GAMM|nr:TRAP transporter small permease [Halomonas marinisediminis]TDB05439.1 TRAP transporter small permease [Halomonas marinisediminis]
MTYRLRPLYNLGGYLAAACLTLICLLISAQIVGRLIDRLATAIGGERIGLAIPALSDISGFLLVGASFLGLAYTFVHGGHIRVTLLIGRLAPTARAWVEVFCLGVALTLCLYLAWNLYWLLADSIAFNETSYGLVPIPLWIPQSAMITGVILFCLVLVETLLQTLSIAIRRPHTFTIDDSGQE